MRRRRDDNTGDWVRVPGARRPLVLVVEDDWDAMQLYREMLAFRGFRVLACSDGGDAVEQARAHRPAAIVLDLALPTMSGWHVAEKLRAIETTSKIPILAITAHSDPGSHALARSAGCDHVFVKPVEHRQLVRTLVELTSQRPSEAPQSRG